MLRTCVWLECIGRLMEVHSSKDGSCDWANFAFEGGIFNVRLRPGQVKSDDVMALFSFKLPVRSVVNFGKNKDGSSYETVSFRPLNVFADGLQRLEE